MSDLSDLIDAETKPRGEKCTLGVTWVSLTNDDRDSLRKAFASEVVSSNAISRALQKAGHDIKPGTVRRHRKGECRCPEDFR